jgi:two-component sensor histidine kinase
MSHEMMTMVSNSGRGIDGTYRSIGQRHICNIYRDRKEQFSLIADFMLDGLKRKYKCIYIVDENTKDGVLSALKEMEGSVDDSILDKLIFLTKEDSYLKGGSFDPDRMIKLLKDTQDAALAEGYPILRLTGEMTWIFSKLPGVEKLLEYEAKLNYFFPNSKTTAICQYNENKFDAKTLMGVLNTHPVVGIYGKLYENPYYIPPDVYLASLIGEVPVAMYEKARDDVVKRMEVERERRRAELALVETNKKLTILSSLNRHDLSNQLSVIIGYSALVEERNTDPETKKLIEAISKAGETMKAQLEFVKAYQDLGATEPEWIDARSSISSAIENLNLGGISVRIDVPNIKVLADPMLEKVFYNLVDNSIRHGGGVKNIRFSSEGSSDGLRIVFEDDGTGIKIEDKERIFERGFGKNTGLGLYLCREILALTGASIRENGKYKSGARFEIMVPSRNWTHE